MVIVLILNSKKKKTRTMFMYIVKFNNTKRRFRRRHYIAVFIESLRRRYNTLSRYLSRYDGMIYTLSPADLVPRVSYVFITNFHEHNIILNHAVSEIHA